MPHQTQISSDSAISLADAAVVQIWSSYPFCVHPHQVVSFLASPYRLPFISYIFSLVFTLSSFPVLSTLTPISSLSNVSLCTPQKGSAIYPSIISWGFELQYVMSGGFLWQAPPPHPFALIRATQMTQHGVSWKHCHWDWLIARRGFQVDFFM